MTAIAEDVRPGPGVRPLRRTGDGLVTRNLVVAAADLGAIAGSVALTIGQASLGQDVLDGFITNNTLSASIRAQLIRNFLLSIAITWAIAGIYALIRRARGVAQLARLGACLSPLSLAFTLPSLLAYRLWFDKPLTNLVQLAVVVFSTEWLARRSARAMPESLGMERLASVFPAWLRRFAPFLVVFVASTAYVAFAGYYSVIEHWRFNTGGYDLGIYDNLLANLLSGKVFRSPVCTPDMSYLSNHAEFGIFYVAPLYALAPRAETLLVTQAVALGYAAIPLYLFASTQLSRASAALIALAYLLFAPLHGANFYDFHWMPMAIPVWFTLFFALARRKTWLVALAVCFVLPLREETGVMLATLGAFLILSNYWPKAGVVFCVVGPLWFGLMKFVVIPLSGTWWFENMYASLIAPGESGYGSVVKTLLVNPAFVLKTLVAERKLVYVLHLFTPLAFIPLRRPLLALLAAPGVFFTLLTTDYDATISIRFQYTSHWIPWIFASTVISLSLMERASGGSARRAAMAAMAVGLLCHSYVYGAVLQRNVFIGGFERVTFTISEKERQDYRDFQALVAKIPKKASVAASENLTAHISNRPDAYTLKIAHGHAEYLLLSRRYLNGSDRTHAEQATSAYNYGLVASSGDIYLFKQNHENPETEAALRSLGLSQH